MEFKKNKKQKKALRLVLCLGLLMFAALGVLLSPLFEIRQINIVGGNVLTEQEIIAASHLGLGQNIFAFSTRALTDRVSALPFAREAEVARELPGTVIISVTERLALANIRVGNTNTYLLIDDVGMVLSVDAAPRRGLPVVTGVELNHFALGEYLVVENSFVFDDILSLSRIFRRYDFFPEVVNMSDPFDIVLQLGNLDIIFGTAQDADRKVQYLRAISEQFPVGDRGYIYIRDVNERPRFVRMR